MAAISDVKLHEILSASDRNDLMDRFKHFREKKELDKDPLVRYCPKIGCDQHMRAENSQCVKLQCPKCTTEVCFACKEAWHEGVACEALMNN